VCEDDAALRSTLSRIFRAQGHEVVLAHDGGEALRLFQRQQPDVIVMDIGLPDSDGRDVCLALQAHGVSAPVLLLTARDGVHDKVAGFESGADDYLTKPFEVPELEVRVQALLRRSPVSWTTPSGVRLDPERHAVSHGERAATLTPTEFRILAKLLSSPGSVIRRQSLIAAAWPMGAQVAENTLDVYVT
jgi:two-component system response regulator MprA